MTRAKTKIDGGSPPWRWYAEPDPDREYLAVATIIELGSVWSLPRLEWHTRRIHRQLSHTPGLVGFSFKGHFPYRYWTLSAWADGKALHGFVRGGNHRTAMPVFTRRMRDFAHVHWKVPGSALPLLWADGLSRARRTGRPQVPLSPPHRPTLGVQVDGVERRPREPCLGLRRSDSQGG